MTVDPSSTSPSGKSVVSELEFSQQNIGNAPSEELQDHQRNTHSTQTNARNVEVSRGTSSSNPGLDQSSSLLDGNRDVRDAQDMMFPISTG
jgi:hypothetical protein